MLSSAIGVVFVTQVPNAEMDQNLPVEDMTHEPLVFLSGTFKGSQMRWATIDKEGFAIVSTFRRLGHFLCNGVHIFTDHRNLADVLYPEPCVCFEGVGAASGGLERCSWPVWVHYLSHSG